MVRHFERFGLRDAHIEKVRSSRWAAKSWGLRVGGTRIPSFPAVNSAVRSPRDLGPFSTGADGLTAPVVDVGASVEAVESTDVSGKIVLFDIDFLTLPLSLFQAASYFSYDPEHTLQPTDTIDNPYLTNISDMVDAAIRGGAVGFVGVLNDYFDSNKYYNENIGRWPIPGLWVSEADGAELRSALTAEGPQVTANLKLEGAQRAVTGRTAMAFLPGRSKDTIMIQSHHDSVWEGGTEDGSGAAEVLALARHYGATSKASRRKSLMFVTFDTHWTGYQSHSQFVRRYIRKHPKGREIVANVTVEHIARRANVVDGELRLTNSAEPRGIFQNTSDEVLNITKRAIVKNNLVRTSILPTDLIGVPTDANDVYSNGVPIISLISGPIYLYDKADTIKTVLKSDLGPVANAFVQIVNGLSRTPSSQIPASSGD